MISPLKLHLLLSAMALPAMLSAAEPESAFIPVSGITLEQFWGGAENLALITTAREITVFRTASARQKVDLKTVKVGPYECLPQPSIISGTEARQLGAVLVEVKHFGGDYFCGFDPGVVLRFTDEKHRLTIAVCFTCGEIRVNTAPAALYRPGIGNQTSFSPEARKALVALAKKAFPTDPEIQKLTP